MSGAAFNNRNVQGTSSSTSIANAREMPRCSSPAPVPHCTQLQKTRNNNNNELYRVSQFLRTQRSCCITMCSVSVQYSCSSSIDGQVVFYTTGLWHGKTHESAVQATAAVVVPPSLPRLRHKASGAQPLPAFNTGECVGCRWRGGEWAFATLHALIALHVMNHHTEERVC